MSLDLTSLRYAVLAADTHSFARAAAAMRVKQATLSRRVSALEARIGVKLFERSTRGAVPTEAGQSFIELARSILSDLDGLVANSRAIGSGRIGTLGVGFSTSLASGHMRALIVDFLEHHSEVRIVGVEGNRRRLARALHARAIDLAVISGEIPTGGLKRRPLWSERVMLVLPEGHALAEKERIYWTDVRGERFIVARQDPGVDLADMLMARLGEPGVRPDVVTHDVTRDNVINMVSLGRFLSLTTEAALGRTMPGVVLREIHDNGGQAHIDYAGYWRNDNSNPTLAQVLKRIAERYPG
ncbi:MAG: LysR family transcriptional regulator [Pseudomonadota bacterium]|nr:LysR family transcriptional regulator [Pseudomonadota bacterium]